MEADGTGSTVASGRMQDFSDAGRSVYPIYPTQPLCHVLRTERAGAVPQDRLWSAVPMGTGCGSRGAIRRCWLGTANCPQNSNPGPLGSMWALLGRCHHFGSGELTFLQDWGYQ